MVLKYKNNRVTVDGITFDSAGEARRWAELQLLQRAGKIGGLMRQHTLPLSVKGAKICAIRPDFRYTENDRVVYED